ncbi:Ubiquitin-conjugating enzyme family protein [Reticulomyxa filosa]|uniref:Ubiquitin-conjugating enzyme family protein n=1 Tax=Reticulomyxa filosa TaxID=46433 RepID=X6NSC3_RETFI|nr:Ubiquitin-conjugating enzyme family protein [Reticulomyxa filosa]|eukprot:ETO28644.1 Ubiquitin-conjugating enzyme family protein [Reticulomyxa filosa]
MTFNNMEKKQGSGSVCLNALNHDWKECYTLYQMMTTLLPYLLRTPNGSDPLNQEAGSMCENSPNEYASRVKEMVKKYALLHQLEPLLKSTHDWRTKQSYRCSATSSTSFFFSSSSSSASASSSKEKSGNEHAAEKKQSAMGTKHASSSSPTNQKTQMANDSDDGIDDNALLDSSDSDNDNNKDSKNKNIVSPQTVKNLFYVKRT